MKNQRWRNKRVKFLISDYDGIKIGPFGSSLTSKEMTESGYKVYGQENLIKNDFKLGNKYIDQSKFEELRNYQIFPRDVVISMMGTIGKCKVVPEDIEIGIMDSHLLKIKVKEEVVLPEFFSLLVDQSSYVKDQIFASSKGSIMSGLNSSIIKDLVLILPEINIQKTIINFLENSLDKIDLTILKKKKLIELLHEKRQALINEAVTKGLNRDAPMKDSGIEWMGNVPVHWKYLKTKYVAKMKSGHTPSRKIPEYWKDCYIPWVSLSDVHQLRSGKQEYLTETTECISKLGLNNSSAELLPEKTVILSRTASVGFSGIISKPMATTQDFVNWVCGPKILPEYLLYVFRSMKYEFNRLNMGSTHKTIYMPDALNFSTPLPSINEQSEIVEYIRKKAKSIDLLEEKIIALIKNLSDYRQSLISEAVTGKIDVREYAKEVVQ